MTVTDTHFVTTTATMQDSYTPKQPDPVPALTAIEAIVLEAGCTQEKATQVYDMFAALVETARRSKTTVHHLTRAELDEDTGLHEVLDTIMPDDTTAKPGTAHALLEQELLDPTLGEVAIVHLRTGKVIKPCAVKIELRRSS